MLKDNYSILTSLKGVTCPQCAKPLHISIDEIEKASGFVCPFCGLTIQISKTPSEKTQEAINKLNKINNERH